MRSGLLFLLNWFLFRGLKTPRPIRRQQSLAGAIASATQTSVATPFQLQTSPTMIYKRLWSYVYTEDVPGTTRSCYSHISCPLACQTHTWVSLWTAWHKSHGRLYWAFGARGGINYMKSWWSVLSLFSQSIGLPSLLTTFLLLLLILLVAN